MAAAPAIVRFVGGDVPFALRATRTMYEITTGEHPVYQVPSSASAARRPASTSPRSSAPASCPQINTGMAGRVAGTGQVGAGLVTPPASASRGAGRPRRRRPRLTAALAPGGGNLQARHRWIRWRVRSRARGDRSRGPAPAVGVARARSRERIGAWRRPHWTARRSSATIKEELRARVAALAERGVVPGLAPCSSATTPAATGTSAPSTATAPDRHPQHPPRPSGRHDPGRGAARGPRAQRGPRLHRLHRAAADRASTRTPSSRAVDPAKDVDGLHPTNLGWLVLGGPAPLPCTPVGCIELLRRYDVPIAGAKVVVVGPRPHRRPPAGPHPHPALRERHGHVVPHRHPRPCRRGAPGRHRRRGGRGPGHRHRRHGQARRGRARRRRLAGSSTASGKSRIAGDVTPTSGRSPAWSAPTRAGSGR